MAARYWVGGAGTWDSTNTANWSATSGGAGGASVPGASDSPTFDSLSGSGTVTFTDTTQNTGTLNLNSANITLSLGAAMTRSGTLIISAGTFTTNNYNLSVIGFTSSSASVRTINLGSSVVTITGSGGVSFGTTANLTLNAGTSQINLSSTGAQLAGGGKTFYNVSWTSTSLGTFDISGANTFNNLTFPGKTSNTLAIANISANQTVNGTLTVSGSTGAAYRLMLRSNVLGTQRTITCAAVAAGLRDVDFRDIAIAGAAAPISGTRLGDCKGNSGITFGAAKTVYYRATGSGAVNASGAWSATSGGAADDTMFPLAQDTAAFPATTYPAAGSTISFSTSYNLGTLDFSARASDALTVEISSDTTLHGNWVSGAALTPASSAAIIFAGRNAQTITSAGRTFTQQFTVDSPGGTVTLQDALTSTRISNNCLSLLQGTFNANNYNVTFTAGGVSSSGTLTRQLDLGSGTWTIGGSGSVWAFFNLNLTVTGSGGVISFTSASAKTFNGGGLQVWPTVNQGGVGTLTFQSSNKLAGLTNTVNGTTISFPTNGTTEFTTFSVAGVSGSPVTLNAVTGSTTLKKATPWKIGVNSIVTGGSNVVASANAEGIDWLVTTNINGLPALPAGGGSFISFF